MAPAPRHPKLDHVCIETISFWDSQFLEPYKYKTYVYVYNIIYYPYYYIYIQYIMFIYIYMCVCVDIQTLFSKVSTGLNIPNEHRLPLGMTEAP